MKTFLKVCRYLKNNNRLRLKDVDSFMEYLRFPVNKNRFFSIHIDHTGKRCFLILNNENHV